MRNTVHLNATMNQLEDMQIFAATVEAGSFTAAAERLGLSKQFVSRRVMALEERLGVRLLNRSTRRLSVTELGREFFERVGRILEDVADAEQAMCRDHASPRGTLRIAAPVSFGTLHLSPRLPALLARYPELRLEIDLNDRYVDLLAEGYDMAIRIGALRDSSLVARALAPVRMLACASPGYLAARGTPASPAELAHHDCLPYGHSRGVEWQFQQDGKPLGIAIAGRLRANNGELARDAAIAGLGIALLPEFMLSEALEEGRLLPLLEAYAPPPSAVHAVYPRHRQSSVAIRACVDFLKEALNTDCDTLPAVRA